MATPALLRETASDIVDPLLRRLHGIRWPDGFRCGCGRTDGKLHERGHQLVYVCPCSRKTALTAGTMIEGTHLPPATWWRAAQLFARLGRRLTVRRLKDHLRLTQKVAWRVIQTLRQAYGSLVDRPLSGEVGFEVFTVEWGDEFIHVAALVALDRSAPTAHFIRMSNASVHAVSSLLRHRLAKASKIRFGGNAIRMVNESRIQFSLPPVAWPARDTESWSRRLNRLFTPKQGPQPTLSELLGEAAFVEIGHGYARARSLLAVLFSQR